MRYKINNLLTTDAQSEKDGDKRCVKAYLDNGIYIVLNNEYYSDADYKLTGYFDSRDGVFYPRRDFEEFDYIGKISSMKTLISNYKEAFTKLVNAFIEEHKDELLTKGKAQCVTPVIGLDAKKAYLHDDLDSYLPKFNYDDFSWYEAVNNVKDLSSGILLDYLMKPKETLEREISIFLENEQVLKALANIVTEEKTITDGYNALVNNPSEEMKRTKQIYQIIKDLDCKTFKIYLDGEGVPRTIDAKAMKAFCMKFNPIFVIVGKEPYYIKDIYKITFGKKVLYERGKTNE